MRLKLFALLSTIGLVACGSGEVTYSGTIWPMIEDRCISCHGEDGQAFYDSGILFTDAATTYDTLLNGAVSEDVIGGFTKYIVPMDPDNSVFFDKVANDPHNSGGDPMPGSGMGLPSSDIDDLRTWIMAGALNN